MTKLRSLIYAGIGAAAIAYGSCQYTDSVSSKSVFSRQKNVIDRMYKMERRDPSSADRRAQRLADLRKGLKGLEGASGEKRCRFEADFKSSLMASRKGAKKATAADEEYEPYSHCKPAERAKDKSVAIPFLAGIIAFLYGAFSFFRRSEDGPRAMTQDGVDRQKKMESERKTALQALGCTRSQAAIIAKASMDAMSIDEAILGPISPVPTLTALTSYGFSADEVKSLLHAYPSVLNKSPEYLAARFLALESDGKTSDQVRAEVLRLPGILG
ncbi:MAG: hypothetical protein V1827_06625 [Candidatus Micrarchaeota archaeon]